MDKKNGFLLKSGAACGFFLAGIIVGGIMVHIYYYTKFEIKEARNQEMTSETTLPKSQVEAAASTLKKTTLPYPYPVSWTEKGADVDLIGVSFGDMVVTNYSALYNYSDPKTSAYKVGEKIHTLILHLKINTHNSVDCFPLNLRRLLNEEGDLLSPNTSQFRFKSGGCFMDANQVYPDNQVIFVVPETEREFYITTGGASNIYFTITILADGSVKVQNEVR